MKRLGPVVAALAALFFAVTASAQGQSLTPEQDARYHQLNSELRCLVCQNQTIAESNAPLAVDLREQVKKQLIEGRSDAQITLYLTDRYGDFVLYNPPLKASTVLLWAGPFLLLLGGLLWAWRFARSSRKPAPAPRVVDEAAVQKLLQQTRAALAAQDQANERPS